MAKYWWLRLDRGFFKRHDTRIIASQENGEKYVNFYLKMMCESVDHGGRLRFSEALPYDDKMIAAATETDIDIVRSASMILNELGLMEKLDDGTIYMPKAEEMTGSVTDWAEKKQKYREKKKEIPDMSETRPVVVPVKEPEIDESGARYKNLVLKYGKKEVDEHIQAAKDWNKSKGGRKYTDFVHAGANWLRKSEADGKITPLVGFNVKAVPKMETVCECGGAIVEYSHDRAMCKNCRREWGLVAGEWGRLG